jgi:branched-chain amino acid transport system permease protein
MSKETRFYIGLLIGFAALLFAFILPMIANTAQIRVVTDFFKLAAMASAWNLIGGFTGYASFGQVAFFGLGGYATGYAMVNLGWSFAPALVLGALICVVFALLLGIPILRLKGHYFAIATLGAAEGVKEIFKNIEAVEANRGLVLPPHFAPEMYYYLTLIFLIVVVASIWAITKTRFGYGLIAIREDEEAADVLGVNTRLYKTAAFVISGLIVGIIGGIHTYHVSYIEPNAGFDVLRTIEMIVMAVIGGAGTVFGPLIGAALIFFSSEYLASLSENLRILPVMIFGVLLIVSSLFLPRGLMGILSGKQKLSLSSMLENIRSHRV